MRYTTSLFLTLPLALVLTVACGDRTADETAASDTANVAAIEVPATPRIVSIDIGRAVDENNRILGGGVERFPQGDTLYVALGASHVSAGTPITVRFSLGDRVLETVELTAPEPTADGSAHLTAKLPSAAAAAPGLHRVEVLLDGTSQGIREITFDG